MDEFITYCLKLERNTGQITLSHAGPNSIYNDQTISHRFHKSQLALHDLKYIQISAGSQKVPVRNLTVGFKPIADLHPPVNKHFKRSDAPPATPRSQASQHSPDDKSRGFIPKGVDFVMGQIGFDKKKALQPCRYSINCREQSSEEHCKKYSHPCRFSELCRNQSKEPNLTHELTSSDEMSAR